MTALTAQDVADDLQIAKGTVYALAREGKIDHLKIGKQIRITPEQLADYKERCTVTASQSRKSTGSRQKPIM